MLIRFRTHPGNLIRSVEEEKHKHALATAGTHESYRVTPTGKGKNEKETDHPKRHISLYRDGAASFRRKNEVGR
jgi:hypothetical protein